MKYDSIIVGAGFAGSIAARRMADKGKKVLVLERRNHIGGNCYDQYNKHGILIHKYGPHIFHTTNKQVWDYLSQFTKWHNYQHEVLAHIDGQLLPVPFNFNSIESIFPKMLAEKYISKLLEKYGMNTKVPIMELLNQEDQDLINLANYVFEKVFLNYTMKQWGTTPDKIDKAVTARVPIYLSYDNRYFQDKYQGMPKDGYTPIFKKILNHQRIHVKTNFDALKDLSLKSGKVFYKNTEFSGKIVYSGMIDELFGFKYGNLPYRTLDFQYETFNHEKHQPVGTVNYPNNYDFTRITEYKNLTQQRHRHTTIVKEYPAAYNNNSDELPYYPFFDDNAKKLYREYKAESERYPNLVLLGRLAEYKYYNMDGIVHAALNSKEIL